MSKNLKLNCQGAALVTVLVFMVSLILLGNAAWILTNAEINFSARDRHRAGAFYLAEAGIEEVRGRLKGASDSADHIQDPSSNPNPLWSAYVITSDSWQYSDDSNYNPNYRNFFPTTGTYPDLDNTSKTVNSLQTDMRYWVKIRHKREYDAERAGHTGSNPLYFDGDGNTSGGHTVYNPGSIIYYGYRDSSSTTLEEFTTTSSSPQTAKPVGLIYSKGTFTDTSKAIQAEVASPAPPPILGGLYCTSASGNGNVSINGNDSCSGNSIPSVAYLDVDNLSGGGNVTLDPPAEQATEGVNISSYIDSMKSQATITLASDQNNLTIGSAENYEIVYCDATVLSPDQELDFDNLTGHGTLLVKGDVRFQGNLDWHGIIVASGNVDFYGGNEDRNVHGAVLAGSIAAMQGTMSIQYNSCEVDNTNQSTTYKISRWEEL